MGIVDMKVFGNCDTVVIAVPMAIVMIVLFTENKKNSDKVPSLTY